MVTGIEVNPHSRHLAGRLVGSLHASVHGDWDECRLGLDRGGRTAVASWIGQSAGRSRNLFKGEYDESNSFDDT